MLLGFKQFILTKLKKSAKIHNGFWLWKIIFLLGLLTAMFFAITSVGGTGEEGFLLIWKNVGLTIGCLFVFWQMWVFVRFATSWSKSWYQVSEPRYKGDKVTFYLMID